MYELHSFVNGARCTDHRPGGDDYAFLDFHNGNKVRARPLSRDTVRSILDGRTRALAGLQLHEIVAFLYSVGQNWKSRSYARRELYVSQLRNYLGYTRASAELEANWIAMLLSSHAAMYDLVASELGHRDILDHWIRREEAEVKAQPRGLSLHVLAGNVPLSGVGSVIRALLTKNQLVIKASSLDPFTPMALAQSFSDVNAGHPVARAMSVVWWPGGADLPAVEELLSKVDVICAWGGQDAVDWAAGKRTLDREVVLFGPKRSVAYVDADADLGATARALAHDICQYDQRACFSVQQVFTTADADSLSAALADTMRKFDDMLPRNQHSDDELAAVSLFRNEANYLDWPVLTSECGSWTVCVCPPSAALPIPMARTVLIHPVSSHVQVIPFLNSRVQTLVVAPWRAQSELRDAAAAAGVMRIVGPGMANVFRPGGAHDGFYPLQKLVQFSSVELPMEHHARGLTVALDQTKFLEAGKFLEFVP